MKNQLNSLRETKGAGIIRNIMLSNKSIHRGNLILVNGSHPVVESEKRGYIAVDMKPGGDIAFTGMPGDEKNADTPVLLETRAASILAYVFRNIRCGDDIVPVSGYRSGREQRLIYEDSLKKNGESFTKKYVALPGHSEHQTGLAIDLGIRKKEMDFIRPDFPYEGICQKFRVSAARFGFIERYRKEKEVVTGISHEPWHFRYVGYPHSEIMEEMGFSLEEYTEFIKGYPYAGSVAISRGKSGKHLSVSLHGQGFEMFYVKEELIGEISLPEQSVWEISGNNTDGYVVTVWQG